MRLVLASVLVCMSASAALARPVTFGVAAGTIQSETDNDNTSEGLLQAWGRVGLTGRLSGQLDLARVDVSGNSTTVRGATALLVLDLGPIGGAHGKVFPIMFGGAGIDEANDGYGGTQDGSHVEVGVGIEVRLDGGLVLGVDGRIGSLDVETQDYAYATAGTTVATPVAFYAPIMQDGEYRSIRAGVGIRF